VCSRHGPAKQAGDLHKGELLAVEPGSVIDKLVPGDIFIKGANAVDPCGNVGVLMAGPGGGTMGQFYMGLKAQAWRQSIPSASRSSFLGGRGGPVWREVDAGADNRLPRRDGLRRGRRVVTEIEAIDSLFGLNAIHYASGGWGGAEGAVTLIVEGEDDAVGKCLDLIEKIKGEPPLPAAKSPARPAAPPAVFREKDIEELPAYLK